ncbi:MAG: hypothetical protein IT521_00290 [Burkholderiales bacterium]|nr:hypothetical protein [Burkholderiales bacterium]
MRFTLVVPGLLAVEPLVLASIAPLARIAAYAHCVVAAPEGLAQALIAAAGGAPARAAAPLAALGAGLDPGSSNVQFADPVALVAGRDTVLLEGRIDDLAPAQALALIATLNGHFANDGLIFAAPRPDTWFLLSGDVAPAEATPLPMMRGAIAAHLPRGDFGGRWRRWMAEVQMLLHGHAVNDERERAGLLPVTSVWFWGGGRAPSAPGVVDARIFAPPGRSGDVARGLASRSRHTAGATPAGFSLLPHDADAIVVCPPVIDTRDLATLADAWLGPAVVALERGDVGALALIADGRDAAAVWTARTPSAWARLRARITLAAFALPTADLDE